MSLFSLGGSRGIGVLWTYSIFYMYTVLSFLVPDLVYNFLLNGNLLGWNQMRTFRYMHRHGKNLMLQIWHQANFTSPYHNYRIFIFGPVSRYLFMCPLWYLKFLKHEKWHQFELFITNCFVDIEIPWMGFELPT
jgi:hypothetical protein